MSIANLALPSVWNVNVQNVNDASVMIRLDHGMYAGIPIICKGPKCPFALTCMIPVTNQQVGDRCPVEIAAIVNRFQKYCTEFGIDPSDDRQTVDLGFVKDLIDIEVMMLRADQKMAIDADFIESVVAAIGPDGKAYYKNELSKSLELKDKLRMSRQKILEKMNSTRKDKESSLKGAFDASTNAANLMAKVKELQKDGFLSNVVDITNIEMVEEGE